MQSGEIPQNCNGSDCGNLDRFLILLVMFDLILSIGLYCVDYQSALGLRRKVRLMGVGLKSRQKLPEISNTNVSDKLIYPNFLGKQANPGC
jgi:hypothetical protein